MKTCCEHFTPAELVKNQVVVHHWQFMGREALGPRQNSIEFASR
jgi:hypothetical protein